MDLEDKAERPDSSHIAQKIKFFIKDFFSKCDQIGSFPGICGFGYIY